MYVTRLSRSFFSSGAVLFLAACSGSLNGGAPGSDSANEDSDPIALVTSANKSAIQNTNVTTTACFYGALPGAFRVYCPGPKTADESCQAFAETVEVRYETAQGVQRAVARELSEEEGDAIPDACVAFDLPLLPNSGNKLSYHVGGAGYRILSYLRFGDGTPP